MTDKRIRTEDTRWKVSPPTILEKTPVCSLLSSKVECGRTGACKEFFRFDFPPWVNIVARQADGMLLLIQQYRFGTGRLEIEIPGGAVERGEDPLFAGTRELLEETGYEGEEVRLIGKVCPNPALQDNICNTVFVDNIKKVADPSQDEMEDIRTLLVPEQRVFEMVAEGIINHGLVLNGLMFYQMMKK